MLSLKKMAMGAGVLLSVVSFSPFAFAGAGGLAGSAAFDATGAAVNGAGVASAIGQNGAAAWALNDSTAADLNSAGAIGSSGVTTIAGGGFSASSIGSVVVTGTSQAEQVNTLDAGPDISLQTTGGAPIVTIP